MNNRHEFRLDLARARERELIAAGERARLDGRISQSREADSAATRSATGTRRGRVPQPARLIGLVLRRARVAHASPTGSRTPR
jgi:hypothetical protein